MTRLRILFFFLLVFAFFQNDAGGRTLQSSAGLVVADSEQASQAGMEILRRGGNAVDAAIADGMRAPTRTDGSVAERLECDKRSNGEGRR